MRLNTEQQQAVDSNHPQICCVAPAGSGKTAVLIHRVVRLLREGVNPRRILVVTFTRAAAEEMAERIRDMWDGRHLPEISTIHAWCAGVLRQFPAQIGRTAEFTIYDETDRADLLRAIATDLRAVPNPDRCRLSTLERRADVMAELEQRLADGDAVTFSDLERYTYRLLGTEAGVCGISGTYQHVLIDEYQDTSPIQADIVECLLPLHRFVVGDPRQAIYGFRGADPSLIEHLVEDPDWQTIQLDRNYRSRPGIVRAANAIAGGDLAPMSAVRPWAESVTLEFNLQDEAGRAVGAVSHMIDRQGMAPESIAILGRSWRHLEQVRELLRRYGIPYTYGGAEEDPWDTPDGRMLARLVLFWLNPRDLNLARWLDGWGVERPRCGPAGDVRREVFGGRRPVLDVMAERSELWARWRGSREDCGDVPWSVRSMAGWALHDFAGVDESDAASHAQAMVPDWLDHPRAFRSWWLTRGVQERARELEGQGVTLTTIHGAKGLEWPTVILLRCIDGVYPADRRAATQEEREEDCRCLYVGVTRAQDRLLLLAPRERELWGGRREVATVTPYLDGVSP